MNVHDLIDVVTVKLLQGHCTIRNNIYDVGPCKGRIIYPRDAARKRGILATETWLAGWLDVCHTPVLCLYGKTYLKTFSTIC